MFHVLAREPTTVRGEGGEEVGEEEERKRRLEQQLECMTYLHSLREPNDLLLTSDKVRMLMRCKELKESLLCRRIATSSTSCAAVGMCRCCSGYWKPFLISKPVIS